jgi:hypothetical protein
VCRSKHVEPSMNGGMVNSIERLHLVGYFPEEMFIGLVIFWVGTAF